MTTTELIKILKDNEYGGISYKPREISLFINGRYNMPNPQITLSSTGDGVVGPEIDLDIDGELFGEEGPRAGRWIDTGSGQKCSECGEIQHGYDNYRIYCAYCGAKMKSEV